MNSLEQLKPLVASVLNLGASGSALRADTMLLGCLPELDSMSIVELIAALEDRFGIVIDDDDISAEVFESMRTLAAFVDRKSAA